MSEDKAVAAGVYTFIYASGAACTSGCLKFFLPVPGIDVGPLTYITKKMCDHLTSIYQYKSLKGLSTFTAVLVGAASGIKLATEISSFIPVAGAGASAIATFTLHALTGFSLIIVFEALKEGTITEEDIKNTSIGLVSILLGIATDIVGDIVRGRSMADTINTAKITFRDQIKNSLSDEQKIIYKDFI